LTGCQGWDLGGHWLGDGNADPSDESGINSDSGLGQDAAQRIDRTIK